MMPFLFVASVLALAVVAILFVDSLGRCFHWSVDD